MVGDEPFADPACCYQQAKGWERTTMLRRRRRQPVRIEIEPEELARRYRDGASLDDLDVLCQCTGTRIRTILAALGVEIRPRGYNPRGVKTNKFLRR
jgi:hypothetical protein